MRIILGMAIVAVCAIPHVHAALGEKLTVVQQSQSRAVVAAAVSHSAGYSVRHSQDAAGIAIREYAKPDGTVFGVAWTGADIPDLSALLGAGYFAEYVNALGSSKGSSRSVQVNNSDLVVQSSGRGNRFRGRAWLKSQLPAGVSAEVIQ